MKTKILVVVTSHGELGATGTKTGFWLEELAVPYLAFVDAGAEVELASPKGGRPPADPKSEGGTSPELARFLADPVATAKLASTIPLETVDPAAYDAVFVAGGHGVMWDMAESPVVARLLSAFWAKGRVVAAVCHGPAALVGVTTPDGKPLVAGRRFAAFSDEEEQLAGLTDVVPFLLETQLARLGGKYERGPAWAPFAVRDGKLVTGQNPASSGKVAEEVLAALRE